jgi:2-keto-4-pentenoate hydratase
MVFGEDRVHVAAHPISAIELAKQQLALAGDRANAGAIIVTGSITLIGDVLRMKQQEMDDDV